MRLVAGLLALSACGGSNGNDVDAKESTRPYGNGSTFLTSNESVSPLVGYHGLFDRTHGQCIVVPAEDGWREVGSIEERLEVALVNSKEQLASQLGIKSGVQAQIGPASAELGAEVVSSFNESSENVTFVLSLEQSYAETVHGTIDLTDDAKAALADGAEAFGSMCGAHYLNGVRYGAAMHVIVNVSTQSVEAADAVKTSLGVSPGAIAQLGEVSVQTDVSDAVNTEGIDIDIHIYRKGYLSEVSMDTKVLADPDELGIKISEIWTEMAESLEQDRENAECENCDRTRSSVPLGVEIGFYESLPATLGYESVFDAIYAQWDAVSAVAVDLATVVLQMEAAYSELDAFFNSEAKQDFNLYGDDQLVTTDQLVERALAWDAVLATDLPDSRASAVADVLSECLTAATSDVTYHCDDATLGWSEVLDDGFEAITEYEQEGRILPVQYAVAQDGVWWWADPWDACEDLEGEYRLPNSSEVMALAPAIAASSYDEAIRHGTYIEPTADCDLPIFVVDPVEATTEIICADNDNDLDSVFCVPQAGPFAAVDPTL